MGVLVNVVLLLVAIVTKSIAVPTKLTEGVPGVDCFEHPLDIIFIVDGSNSVSPAHFQLVKNFIVKLVKLHDIGPKQTQIGVIQYGSTVMEEIALDEYTTNDDIVAAVRRIRHMQKGSMAGEALKYLVTKTLAGRSIIRTSNPTLLTKAIVITDGASQDYSRGTMTKYQALAKEQGVEMYAIGVGVKDQRGLAELKEIASTPKNQHVFNVDDYEAIEQLNEIWDSTKVCVENECETGNNRCDQLCINTIENYYCDCHEGYALGPDGHSCIDVDECETDLNICQVCVNTPGSFYCECNEGYVLGEDGSTCIDINECEDDKLCEQLCVNTVGSYYCACMEGYELLPDGHSCEDIDECGDGSVCPNGCVNTAGSFECNCPEGFELAADKSECIDIDECGDGTVCPNGCVNTAGSFECNCPEGFKLSDDKSDCIDIDECANGDSMCTTTQMCLNTNGSYRCVGCAPGFELSDDTKSCIDPSEDDYSGSSPTPAPPADLDGDDVNECTTELNTCEHACVNTNGAFRCECDEGYELAEDRASCIDIDECLTDKNTCSQICVNTPGGHRCECEEGFELADDGVTCNNVDECAVDNGGCGQICVNTPGSFECECNEGYTIMADKTSCSDIDECATNNPCAHQCVNMPGGVQCKCDEGYYLDTDGVTCLDVDECLDDTNICSQICLNYRGFFECQCYDGFVLGKDAITCTVSTITVTVIEETTTTITVIWDHAKGAGLTMYVLTYCKVGEEDTDKLKNDSIPEISNSLLLRLLRRRMMKGADSPKQPAILPDCVLELIQCSMMELDSSTVTATLENLDAHTRYRISVVPWFGIVKGEQGHTYGTTKKLVSNLMNLQITTNTTITIKWIVTWEVINTSHQYEEVAYHNVTYWKEGGTVAQLETNTTKVILVGLQEDTEYTIRVQAVTVDTASRSNTLEETFRTEKAPEPIPPPRIEVIDETPSTITVRWQAKGDGLTTYVITYCKADVEDTDQLKNDSIPESSDSLLLRLLRTRMMKGADSPKQPAILPDCVLELIECSMMELNSSTVTTTLENLDAHTRYRISVVPWYGIVEGEQGHTYGTTKKLVSDLINLQITTNTITIVTWEVVNMGAEYEEVDYYIVTYWKEGGNITHLETNTTKVILVGLQEDIEYTIRVEAVTVDTASRSNTLEETFKTAAATAPKDIVSSGACSCEYYQESQVQMQKSIEQLIATVNRLSVGVKQSNSDLQYIKTTQSNTKYRCISQRSVRRVRRVKQTPWA